MVLTLPQSRITDETIGDILSSFQATDDVYTRAFDDVLILQTWAASGYLDNSWDSFNSSLFNNTAVHQAPSADALLPEGPYFLDTDRLHQAWRLYDDVLDAFVVPVVPESATKPEKYSAPSPLVMPLQF